jgi:hypothetical protein
MHVRQERIGPLKARVQHHLLNWIVISRYRIVRLGVPKAAAQRSLVALENLLKKINLITSSSQ